MRVWRASKFSAPQLAVMPDVYANIARADAALQERLAADGTDLWRIEIVHQGEHAEQGAGEMLRLVHESALLTAEPSYHRRILAVCSAPATNVPAASGRSEWNV